MRRLIMIMLAGAMMFPFAAGAAEEDASVAAPVSEDQTARQLRIYREALLQGSTEAVRLDAATGLLLHRDPAGRELLVSTLRMSDNPNAVEAICRALIEHRTSGSFEMFIDPLLELLKSSRDAMSRLAAEAMRAFQYEDIRASLTALARDASADTRIGANAIYALQIRPEPEALSDLIKLMDNADADVVRAVESALQEVFGIPVGTRREVWEKILDDLKNKDLNEIRRERLFRQETRLREIETERDQWRRLYLAALDRQYESSDEAGRNAMILELLGADLAPIRLWALDKVDRVPANGQSVWREKLLSLLGDEQRQVRLRTAQILNNMSALNPAERLLECFGEEKEADVALAMYEALGEAVFFAFSPGSKIELPFEVKLETLQIGETYIRSNDIETAKKGAEIVRKILELNDLSEEVAVHYMGVLAERYAIAFERNNPLVSDLLGVMVRLSARGPHQQQAAALFMPYFVEGIGLSDNPSARLAAATGLLQADRQEALRLFKENDLMKVGGTALRLLVLDAAKQAGQAEDLAWLSAYLTVNGQIEAATEAFGAICQRSRAEVVSDWAETLDKTDVSAAFVRTLLELAEQKAIDEKNELLLADVRVRLAAWFVRQRASEPLAAYLDRIRAAGGGLLPDETAAEVVGLLVSDGQQDTVIDLVAARLERGSLGGESAILPQLDAYFGDSSIETEAQKAFYDKLAAIKTDTESPVWSRRLERWGGPFNAQAEAVAASEPDKQPQE